tara:strand:+ start:993 stop:1265 length:273 start_codon:yes stop_codon:yes gene_type:complete
MAFLITCIDKEDSLDLRLATRESHIKYLKGIKDKLILAGPILDKKDLPCGTVLILDFKDLNQVKSFLKNDPYNKVKLFKDLQITKFKKAL